MPSSPVHLKLAYIMADELKVRNKADFLLGSISPDCVNYGQEQASEAVRYAAHIRDRDYDKWKQMLRDFCKENKEKFSDRPDFLKGYLFHCWCDIAWDEAVQPKLFEFLGALGYGYDDMTAQKWQELYRFNGVVTRKEDYRKCTELLRQAKGADIAGCSAELVEKFRDYVADDYKDKIRTEPPLYLSEEHIKMTVEQMNSAGYSAELRG